MKDLTWIKPSLWCQVKSSQVKLFLSSIMRGVVSQPPEPEAHVLSVRAFWVKLEFRRAGFWGEGKTRVPSGKPLRAEKEPTTKLSPHMVRAQNRTQSTSVGGECSHRHTSPAPKAGWKIYPEHNLHCDEQENLERQLETYIEQFR